MVIVVSYTPLPNSEAKWWVPQLNIYFTIYGERSRPNGDQAISEGKKKEVIPSPFLLFLRIIES